MRAIVNGGICKIEVALQLLALARCVPGTPLLTRDRKSSKRVPIVFATERDSNSVSRFATGACDIRKREYCYEEGSFRGADFSAAKLADPLVYKKRREPTALGVLRLPVNLQQLATMRASGPLSRRTARSSRRTPKTPGLRSDDSFSVSKLSRSPFNRASGVNNPVAFGVGYDTNRNRTGRLTMCEPNHRN